MDRTTVDFTRPSQDQLIGAYQFYICFWLNKAILENVGK